MSSSDMSSSNRSQDETQVIRDDRTAAPPPERGPFRGPEPDREPDRTAGPSTMDPYTAVAVIGSIVGAFALIVGIVTIARVGIPADFLEVQTSVGPFERTALMGFIEIVVGLSFISAGAGRNGSLLFALGLLAGVFGIVWLIEPNAFDDALGVNRFSAWIYLLIGIASALVGGWATNRPTTTVIRR